MIKFQLTFIFTVLLSVNVAQAKPVVWVNSDMSDPKHTREGNHPVDDPDDICALAALMLEANRFDLRGVVIASNPRKNLLDPMPFVNDVMQAAYQADLPHLNKKFGGYPERIPFMHSSMNRNQDPIKFDPKESYKDISHFETVEKFIAIAKAEPVYLLIAFGKDTMCFNCAGEYWSSSTSN